MGLVVLHSGHESKIFRRLMGTTCSLRWRSEGDRQMVWTIDPGHPIARGIPHPIDIPADEMYGEHFDIPTPHELVFVSAFGPPGGAASWDWSWVPEAAAQALECLLSIRADWLTANINLPDHGGSAPPAFARLSRASYYRDVYDLDAGMIRSEVGGYPPQAIENDDDIHAFAEQQRTSITLFY